MTNENFQEQLQFRDEKAAFARECAANWKSIAEILCRFTTTAKLLNESNLTHEGLIRLLQMEYGSIERLYEEVADLDAPYGTKTLHRSLVNKLRSLCSCVHVAIWHVEKLRWDDFFRLNEEAAIDLNKAALDIERIFEKALDSMGKGVDA
jgi:hypothetical protein